MGEQQRSKSRNSTIMSSSCKAIFALVIFAALLDSSAAFRACNFNTTDSHRDARCAVYEPAGAPKLEPIAVQQTSNDKMFCYWPDSTVPLDQWEAVQVGQAKPVNLADWNRTTEIDQLPPMVRDGLTPKPTLYTCHGAENCCFDGDGQETYPPSRKQTSNKQSLMWFRV